MILSCAGSLRFRRKFEAAGHVTTMLPEKCLSENKGYTKNRVYGAPGGGLRFRFRIRGTPRIGFTVSGIAPAAHARQKEKSE